jgi:hypothetical protein
MEADINNVEADHFLLRYVSEPSKLSEFLGIGEAEVKPIDKALTLLGMVAQYQKKQCQKTMQDKSFQPDFEVISSCHQFVTNLALELLSNHCELITIQVKTRKNQKDE